MENTETKPRDEAIINTEINNNLHLIGVKNWQIAGLSGQIAAINKQAGEILSKCDALNAELIALKKKSETPNA